MTDTPELDRRIVKTTPAMPPITQMSEEELAKSIKDKHSMMLSSFRNSVTHAMDVGDLLTEAKKRVGHGNFEAWCATHCQLSARTVRRYMGMAKHRTKIEAGLAAKTANLADLNAGRLLTDQSGGGPTESAAKDNAAKKEGDANSRWRVRSA